MSVAISADGNPVAEVLDPGEGSSRVTCGLSFKVTVPGTYCTMDVSCSFSVNARPGEEPKALGDGMEAIRQVLVEKENLLNELRAGAGVAGRMNFRMAQAMAPAAETSVPAMPIGPVPGQTPAPSYQPPVPSFDPRQLQAQAMQRAKP